MKLKISPRFRKALSVSIVGVVVLIMWLPDRLTFRERCAARGKPLILKTTHVDGFFLDDPTANSFGMRYLEHDGFSWLEAKSIYHPEQFTRYEKQNTAIKQIEIKKISADYRVHVVSIKEPNVDGLETTITRLDTGEKLASAASLIFDGGRAKWVLGGWGVASCPSAATSPEVFKKMYDLVRLTLRP